VPFPPLLFFNTNWVRVQILGASDSASSFHADEVEGPVYLTVQKSSPLPVNLSDKTSGRDRRQDKKDATNVDINTAMLFSLLKSFGSLRRFDFDAEAGERDVSLFFVSNPRILFVSSPVSVLMGRDFTLPSFYFSVTRNLQKLTELRRRFDSEGEAEPNERDEGVPR